jgi:hypothetical protein
LIRVKAGLCGRLILITLEAVMLNETYAVALAIVAFLLTFLVPVRGVSVLGPHPLRRLRAGLARVHIRRR